MVKSGVIFMFMGQYVHSIDAKGRVIVPSKFREGLGLRFVATAGNDNCLNLYTMEEWDKLEAKLNALPSSNKIARMYVRKITSNATECEPDNNGRVLIPQNLKDYAGISKEIISIGVNDHVEIWDKAAWDKYNEQEVISEEEMEAALAEFGI